jgi:predicted Zn-dependent peptidase
LGYFETIGSWGQYRELIPRLAYVTLDHVNAAARKYLPADNMTVGWFEPAHRQDAGQGLRQGSGQADVP